MDIKPVTGSSERRGKRLEGSPRKTGCHFESGITAESIRQSIAVVCGEETSPILESLEVSIGVILAPWDSEYNMDVYLNQADEAMYEEKKMYHEKYGDRRRR